MERSKTIRRCASIPDLGADRLHDDNWESTAGGESAHLAPDPRDNDIVYGGSYGGFSDAV